MKYIPYIIFLFLGIFSLWLMWHTLSYNSATHQILVSAKFYSDFGGYLPQIRSFSLGKNWPPQYPLYPGQPTRYHFLFYMLVGLLEKLGLRLDFALNLPSAFGFILLLVAIWYVSLKMFSDFRIAWLSLLFFLFNGSFSFLDFLKKYPLSTNTLYQLLHLRDFPSFAPWNGSQISAFWNLNIFTNQRHLGLSLALGLILVYFLYSRSRRWVYTTGFILGLFLVLNQAVFGAVLIFVAWFFLVDKTLRLPILLSSVGALPWLILASTASHSFFLPVLHFGFLTPQPATIISILHFWFLNIGFHLLLIPLGFYLAPAKSRVLLIPLIGLFIIPNVFQLSTDIINNHKFFNFFLLFGVMFTACGLINIWDKIRFGKIMTPLFVLFLTLGGLIDIFPVINDSYIALNDIQSNPDAAYIVNNTPPDSVVLNSTWFYHPASIAGRFIFNGYPYFTWSFGYDQVTRENITRQIYSSPTKAAACDLLQQNNINYVELNPHPENFLHPNLELWTNQFIPSYVNPYSGLKIYPVSQNCSSA